MRTKVCTVCGKEKALEHFHKHNREADGYKCSCRACNKLIAKPKHLGFVTLYADNYWPSR